jgi:hypothetical protein
MTSKLSIYNRALQKLGQQSLASLDVNNKSIRELTTAYEPRLKALLRRYPWNFAIKRVSLSTTGETPAFEYTNEFLIPSDCLRVLKVDSGEYPYKIERSVVDGNLSAIVTNASAPIKIRYIAYVENTSLYDPLFAELLSHLIAIDVCEAITQSNTKKNLLLEELKRVRADAFAADGQEDYPDPLSDGSWWESRL